MPERPQQAAAAHESYGRLAAREWRDMPLPKTRPRAVVEAIDGAYTVSVGRTGNDPALRRHLARIGCIPS